MKLSPHFFHCSKSSPIPHLICNVKVWNQILLSSKQNKTTSIRRNFKHIQMWKNRFMNTPYLSQSFKSYQLMANLIPSVTLLTLFLCLTTGLFSGISKQHIMFRYRFDNQLLYYALSC